MLQRRVICAYIPSSEEVAKKTVTSRSNCPLCSCAQTVTVSPSVTTYSSWVSPTITTVAIRMYIRQCDNLDTYFNCSYGYWYISGR